MKKNNQKGFIANILLIIFLIIIIGAGSYVYKNRQNIQFLSLGQKADVSSVNSDTEKDRILVLLFNFTDSGVEPFTKEKANEMVFNGQVQKFFKEQSYDKFSLKGDVFGWFNLETNAPISNTGCTGSIEESFYGPIIKKNKIDLNKYGRIVMIINSEISAGCDLFSGKREILINNKKYNLSISHVAVSSTYSSQNNGTYNGETLTHFSWTIFDSILSHELGHALGLYHAYGSDCGDKTFSAGSECKLYEYGNPFDTMGMRGDALHFNAFYKEMLGWISPSSKLIITKSGRYTINPLETKSGIKFAKIQLSDGTTPLYLEYRKAIGFDSKLNEPVVKSNQNGLLINHIAFKENISRLLDMSPSSSDWIVDTLGSSLNGDKVFNDISHGVIIGPIVSYDKDSITFDVKINKPVGIIAQIFSPINNSSFNVNESINFVAQTSQLNQPLSYFWSFGDGNMGTVVGDSGINQTHTYINPGRYKVEFAITDSLGSKATATPIYININPSPLQ